ncbi:MAG: hypothetical protein JO339_30170 [Alphaproteobacteria bacterium]|nr:hypothetical protein [Alphaproteobacteria bacterium]
MRYAKDFFDLQLLFARRVAELRGIPLERAVLDYTNIYIRLAIGRGFCADHPLWRAYVGGLNAAPDAGEWTHRFHLGRPPSEPPNVVATFGCFSYAVQQGGRIRLHFANRESGSLSPLAVSRSDARRHELRHLLAHVERTQPAARTVAGVSWLYNLPQYRRLFPQTYLASARVVGDRFRNMPLWGQFLDRHGALKPAAAKTFRERLSRLSSPDALLDCFPLQPLAVEAPVGDFYRALRLPDAAPASQ